LRLNLFKRYFNTSNLFNRKYFVTKNNRIIIKLSRGSKMKTINRSSGITAALLILLCVGSSASHAALSSVTPLFFDGDASLSTQTEPAPGSGSWFAFDTGESFYYTGITTINGLNIGMTQFASGSHSGVPDGSELANIDNPWLFFSNTGMHLTTSPVDILSDDGSGNVLLDFSGWGMTWNGVEIDLGSGSWGTNPEGEAILNCQYDCSSISIVEAEYREEFMLSYSATIPEGHASGLGGIRYQLHLESVGYVPLPASAWLFISGLMGLINFKKISSRRSN